MAQNRTVKITLTAVDKTKAAFRSASKSVKAFGATVSKYMGQLGLAFGVSGGGLLANLRAVTAEFDAISKTAEKLGTTTEELSKLRYAAELTGVQASTLDMALQRMVRRVSEAAKGTGEAKDALKELGLQASVLALQSPDEAFKQIADAMLLVENQSDRVRLAFKLFDSAGVALVNTMALGRDGIEAMGEELANLGGVIENDAAAQAVKLTDHLTRMDAAFSGISRTLANEFIPTVSESAQFWNTLLSGGDLSLALERMTNDGLSVNSALNDTNAELYIMKQRLKDLREDEEGILGVLVPQYAIDEAETEIKRLEEKRSALIEQEAARRARRRQSQAEIEGYKEEVARQAGVKAAAKAAKPAAKEKREKTYSEANESDFEKYRAGEITREEWLKRETARNPYSNPESPYAAEFTPGGSASTQTSSYAPRFGEGGLQQGGQMVTAEFVEEIRRAVAEAMEGRTYKMKVQPELVGMDGVEISAQDTADKEGTQP